MKIEATSIANTLFAGDNLTILQRFIADASVDLIYLDPPFNSKRDYNLIYQNTEGKAPRSQIEAFEDTWHWTLETGNIYEDLVKSNKINSVLRQTLKSFRSFLNDDSLMAYLTMMVPRLIELHRVLKPTGSIYLHCDQSASHYLKIIMDQIFGRENFLNNIVWCYGLGGSSPRRWPRKHDDILWYSREPNRQTFTASMVPATSQRMKGKMKKSPDYWDIPTINNMAKERMGYPTQKPLALLEQIIESSSNPGDLVLDPFCGCGTALVAAEKLGRRWAGIDITYLAISAIENRMIEQFPSVVIHGEGSPTTVEEARVLRRESELKYTSWALSLFGAKHITGNESDDGVLHGELEFRNTKDVFQKIYIGVLSDCLNDDLQARSKAILAGDAFQMAIIVALEAVPNDVCEMEAAFGVLPKSDHLAELPRLQFCSVADLLLGEFPILPAECRARTEKIYRMRSRGRTKWLRGI